ncbi:CBS domain-containing protein [Desulfopila inferna]|uniref:CBS domain-containing protein n=1 Tax=Desulfopila inferna TaxID=468528 RepID=UPI00196448A5|nr:CBS domain-containing protein [Desulfopila inferna]MBM9604671.1 CBS domain-containing protein [Desulfopila inferna]
MENVKVRELMIPMDQFPRISSKASLHEALSTLEKVQEAFLTEGAQQRILLVENTSGKVIGKISPIDIFRGLETKYTEVNYEENLRKFGLTYVWDSMQEDYNLWHSPFEDLCRKAGQVHVKDFVNVPSNGQLVNTENKLSKCFHLFVINRHDALFVKEDEEFVGMLLFADVFSKVSQAIKTCSF